MPTTSGTIVFRGPVETNSVTSLPSATEVPDCGSCLATKPASTSGSAPRTTVETGPSSSSCAFAFASRRPSTRGTTTVDPPSWSWICVYTYQPASAAAASSAMTSSQGPKRRRLGGGSSYRVYAGG